jgi:hypothetical protein
VLRSIDERAIIPFSGRRPAPLNQPLRLIVQKEGSRLLRAAEGRPMGWASGHIKKLQAGETVSFRPRGDSMSGRVESGQLCTVAPVDASALRVGDVVLCKVRGREYLHLVKAVQGARFQIGNNRGHVNGWVSAGAVFGKHVRVEA